MANYIEYIKVGSGESWPVRDTDALHKGGETMAGNIAMAGHNITGLGAPVDTQDAVNKNYVDSNFAPAGYGLGRSAVLINAGDNLNNYTAGGWYQFQQGVQNAPFDWGIMLIIHGTDYNNDTFQYAFSRYPRNNMAIRQKFGGVWEEWEWLNPPMNVGVEYRTTERWQGKVVYTTIINFGNMPNNSTASVSIANLKSTGILSCHGVTNKGDTIPYSWSGEYMTEVSATVNNIYLYTRTNVSDSIAYITLKYIKG